MTQIETTNRIEKNRKEECKILKKKQPRGNSRSSSKDFKKACKNFKEILNQKLESVI